MRHSRHLIHYYRISQDTTEVHIVSSADGIVWSFVPGGAVISPGSPGSWDGGCIFAKNDLVPLPDGRVALPYTGYPVPHKYPRAKRVVSPLLRRRRRASSPSQGFSLRTPIRSWGIT
ncbi:hypothetical protein J7M22_16140 [Candidatus Poribacteria bacterium]|nr:hypothetical protein [Candidatus Poribacteria bacterium]